MEIDTPHQITIRKYTTKKQREYFEANATQRENQHREMKYSFDF